ncbi:hypothetical protein ACX9MO_14740 [Pseudooceanicola sp. 502str34]
MKYPRAVDQPDHEKGEAEAAQKVTPEAFREGPFCLADRFPDCAQTCRARSFGFSTNGVRRVLLGSSAMQVDVPITGSAVQSSLSDATSGKLLKVGAFGCGGEAINITGATPLAERDLGSGIYMFVGSDTPGGPETSAYFYVLQVSKSSSGRRHLLCWRDGSSPAEPRIWTGSQAADGSIVWNRVLTREYGILGTVSEDGGVPTGQIIERSSNTNGEYVKFADGTMLAFSPTFTSGAIATAAGNVYRDSAQISWTYPVSFVSATTSLNVFASLGNVNCWPAVGTFSGSASCYVMSHLNTQSNVPVRFMAIGRWF